ncbi:MAG: hypothetical protein HN405_05010 [Planctomycetes bacterium]|mgnify:CR=1 FL=1|jgi:GTP-binding protein EngB required for normal cell division|nr:hypothetical protein [Planctomycetota bacterium]MBT4028988.1 hypothetical protein [Planctomycetota bacterium]MBT4560256.1 hypothetical protein [Planctomycetota bacterium]
MFTRILRRLFGKKTPAGEKPIEIQPTVLEKNFIALYSKISEERENGQRVIAILGQPGAGKSTLLSAITKWRCRPEPKIGQETDATDWHKEMLPDYFCRYGNYSFVDIPGYGTKKHPADSYKKHFPFLEFDQVLLVLCGKLHDTDIAIGKKIIAAFGTAERTKILVLRNQIEGLNPNELKELRLDVNKHLKLRERDIQLVFTSGRTKKGIKYVAKYLGIKY